MNRRVDVKTAELVDIALLTKAAFGPRVAREYLRLRGIDSELMRSVLSLPPDVLRSKLTFASSAGEGRRAKRR